MASDKKVGKGFGSRYGAKVRGKYAQVSSLQKALYKCPYCRYQKAKRKAVGIWECGKCGSEFTSKAYQVSKVDPIKIAPEEVLRQEEVEQNE